MNFKWHWLVILTIFEEKEGLTNSNGNHLCTLGLHKGFQPI